MMQFCFLFIHEGGSFVTEPMTTEQAEKEFGPRKVARSKTENLFRINPDGTFDRMWIVGGSWDQWEYDWLKAGDRAQW